MCALFSCLTDDEHPLLVALEVGLRSGISVAMGLGKIVPGQPSSSGSSIIIPVAHRRRPPLRQNQPGLAHRRC